MDKATNSWHTMGSEELPSAAIGADLQRSASGSAALPLTGYVHGATSDPGVVARSEEGGNTARHLGIRHGNGRNRSRPGSAARVSFRGTSVIRRDGMKRGEVYWADLVPRSGSEQTRRRPVIIVSNDGFNRVSNWRCIVVVPMSTSVAQARRGPTAVPIPGGAAGLARPGIAICHQVTTLDRAKLSRRIGALDRTILLQVEDGLRAALDLA